MASIVVLAAAVLQVACTSLIDSGVDGGREAFVDSVKVEQRGTDYVAVVEGHYADLCSDPGGVNQEVRGTTIKVTLVAIESFGPMCAQILTPFEVEILLETEGLPPGRYTVEVNGVTVDFVIA